MVNLIVAEAELELIPEEIARRPAARASAGRRNRRAEECLLDSSLHHSAMKGLSDAERRGRPDIVHFCLLLALDSSINSSGKLRTFVHTRNDIVIGFDRTARLPRNYGRFTGLMEELLLNGRIGTGDRTLASVREMSLPALVSELGADAFIFSREGRPDHNLSCISREADTTLIIGGFPHGDFNPDTTKFRHDVLSLSGERLMAWTAVSLILSHYHTYRPIRETAI